MLTPTVVIPCPWQPFDHRPFLKKILFLPSSFTPRWRPFFGTHERVFSPICHVPSSQRFFFFSIFARPADALFLSPMAPLKACVPSSLTNSCPPSLQGLLLGRSAVAWVPPPSVNAVIARRTVFAPAEYGVSHPLPLWRSLLDRSPELLVLLMYWRTVLFGARRWFSLPLSPPHDWFPCYRTPAQNLLPNSPYWRPQRLLSYLPAARLPVCLNLPPQFFRARY